MKKFLSIDINPNRIYGLDILRAFAILFVVLGHGSYLLTPKIIALHDFVLLDGVSIFFVLSGFLIGGILIKVLEKQTASSATLFDFWKRRWLRTLPNYFFVLTTLVILSIAFTPGFKIDVNIFKYYIFSQNLFSPHPTFFPEAWSLSIEEWFYLLIPISIFIQINVLKISPRNAIIFTALIILIIVSGFRMYRFSTVTVDSIDLWDLKFRKQVFTRLDSLMFGLIGAYVQYYLPEFWLKNKERLLLIGLVLLFILKCLTIFYRHNFDNLFTCVFSFSISSLAVLCLLPYLSNLKSGSGLIWKIITFISLISYSMYLLNFSLIQNWIIKMIPWESFSTNKIIIMGSSYLMFWVLTILFSILTYKFIEIPFMNLRNKK